ncbi:MAG: hypothetical protein J2P41_05925 [Blastocatellia bacterium]|nr:hypothetical protein [Blastocatellia bacterium]
MLYRLLGAFVILLIAVVFPTFVAAQQSSIDSSLANRAFQEAERLCGSDKGKLWGVSLCGPMLLVDPRTRDLAANQSDKEGRLNNAGDVFVGKLPKDVNIANTAIEWAGVTWTMIVWPLPDDLHDRAQLMAHELWHRVQDQIGLPTSGPANDHLDSLEGRIFLQLEWRALGQALIHDGEQRRKAIQDALIFRAFRRSLFPKADSEERALEMHEGLAEYTGVKLSGRPDIAQYLANRLKEAEKSGTFVRSFAYASGPAYGMLLDEARGNWRRGLKPEHDLGILLQDSLSIKSPQNLKEASAQASRRYSGDGLRASETERERQRQNLMATYRARFLEGPVLVIPLQKMSMEFNPNNLQPLDSFGTIYPDIRIVDVWGILTVSKGALMSSGYEKIQIPAPAEPKARPVRGDGWTLELNAEWSLAPGERKGDYLLKKDQ